MTDTILALQVIAGIDPDPASIHLAADVDGDQTIGMPVVSNISLKYTKALEEITMITAMVQFNLPQPLTLEEARKVFMSTAPKYRATPGLIRKYYLLSQDGTTAGGIYLWESRAAAERLYTEAWRLFIRDKYGAAPSVTFFESPVVVDNLAGAILADD